MSISIKKELSDFIYSLRGLALVFFVFSIGFIIYGVISLDKILKGEGLELFMLGNLPIPKYLGAGASNIEMFIFCVIGTLAIFIGLIRRYLEMRDDIAMMRKLGLKEEDFRSPYGSSVDDVFDDD